MDSGEVVGGTGTALVSNMTSAEWIVLALAIGIAIVTVGIVRSFRISTIKEIDEATEVVYSENQALLSEIKNRLSPRIVHCASETDVAREASAMMNDAVNQHRDRHLASDDHDIDNDDAEAEGAFITFYGAADLGSPISNGLSSEELVHFSNFNDVLAQAVDSGVRVRRHINLFTKEEISKRTHEAKSSYLKWLVTRFEFIISHPSFELIDNPRVPQWGASFSNILTNQAVLEIKANGLSGIAIYHEIIPRAIRESLRRARDMAQRDLVVRIRSADKNSVDSFYATIINTAEWCELDIDEVAGESLVFYNAGSHFDHYRRNLAE